MLDSPNSSSEPAASVSPVEITTAPAQAHSANPDFAQTEVAESPQAAAVTNPLLAMLMGAVLSCVLLGVGIGIGRVTAPGASQNGTFAALPTGVRPGINAASENAIVEAVKRVSPAVMNVDTTFGKTDPNVLPTPGQEKPRSGMGTGVIIDSERGLMLTNAHVVAEAQKIQVTDSKGQKHTGRVLGFDRRSDIAVVEVSTKTLPAARLADFENPDELEIGQWTIAIGNPFGQQNSVTCGVLSATGRTLPVPAEATSNAEAFSLTDMLQTDTAINPGNSGGPLCNIRGEVIGINTAIIPFGQGLGFTIPINKAKSVADRIIKKGRIQRAEIGVKVQPITDALRTDYGLPDKNGALVQSVAPDSPAARVGIQSGDVIRSLNGKTVRNQDELEQALEGLEQNGTKPGTKGATVEVEVLRNNAVKKILEIPLGK